MGDTSLNALKSVFLKTFMGVDLINLKISTDANPEINDLQMPPDNYTGICCVSQCLKQIST